MSVAGIPYWAESIVRLEMNALKLRAEARNRGESSIRGGADAEKRRRCWRRGDD